jgi:hypothetical protein
MYKVPKFLQATELADAFIEEWDKQVRMAKEEAEKYDAEVEKRRKRDEGIDNVLNDEKKEATLQTVDVMHSSPNESKPMVKTSDTITVKDKDISDVVDIGSKSSQKIRQPKTIPKKEKPLPIPIIRSGNGLLLKRTLISLFWNRVFPIGFLKLFSDWYFIRAFKAPPLFLFHSFLGAPYSRHYL